MLPVAGQRDGKNFAPGAPAVTLSAATGNSYVSGSTAYTNPQAGKSGGPKVSDGSRKQQGGSNVHGGSAATPPAVPQSVDPPAKTDQSN